MRGARYFLFAVLAMLAAAPPGASAQGWPAKPVRMLITFPPGGPSEILTRLVNERLQAALAQPFVVENRAGAGGNVGADVVAKSAPDGYLFGITTDTLFTVNPHVYARMPFDVWKDIVPVALLGRFSQTMVCHPSVPANTLRDLLELAKRERITYASGGPGVPGHLAAELLLSMASTSMVHVPYKGPAAATADVMGGQVHCGFLATPTVMPHIKSGKLKGMAVSTTARSPLAPDIPTASEAGVAGFDAPFYLVLFAPRDTPAPILGAMNREVVKALSAAEIKQRAAGLDVVTLGGSPEDAASTLRAVAAKWAPVVRQIGLKLD
jgi:tripartite-type tricarboxylate transporter receptor subunit TctC